MQFELSSIKSGLISLDAVDMNSVSRQGEAAVLVSITQYRGRHCLLLTKRALHMRHHGGEVAFPGGMWEPDDQFPVITALREAEEEIALMSHQVEVVGLLPSMPTRNGTKVTPVVGLINADELSLKPSPEEIDSIFYVPLDALEPSKRIRTDIFAKRKKPLWAPAYDYEGHEIWGFTAGVIKVLLERCFKVHFERQHMAPEKEW
ncbi:MAG: CoA pyrophosphatase [Cellvibrionaceae bacterium]